MGQTTCHTMKGFSYCRGEPKYCEYCLQQVRKKARADELKRIAEDPTTQLFGYSLDYIRRLIAEDQNGQKRPEA